MPWRHIDQSTDVSSTDGGAVASRWIPDDETPAAAAIAEASDAVSSEDLVAPPLWAQLPASLPCTVLVVDDDPGVCSTLSSYLAIGGYKAHMAMNGRDALNYLHDHPIRLVISDIMMPEMDGIELVMGMRALRIDAKIIAISGCTGPISNCLEMAHRLGAHKTVAKPVGGEALLKIVRELIGPPATE